MQTIIVPGEDLPVSYLGLVERHSDRFYTKDLDQLRQLRCASALAEPEPVGDLEWYYNFAGPPETSNSTWRLPTLVEITRCWLTLDPYHGQRGQRIVTSTGNLQLLLTCDEYLDLRSRQGGYRQNSMFVRDI